MGSTLADRFWAKVDTSGDCWEWTAGRFIGGYGSFCVAGQNRVAHRVSYELSVGPIPEGLHLDHLCRNRACVNPMHLEPVLPRINAVRGIGFSGRNFRKTECDSGHPFDEGNTYIRPDGDRGCRTCRAAASQRYKAKRRAAA